MAADTATLTEHRAVAVSTAKNPVLVKGRREFFTYRDLGVTAGSKGHMRAQVTATKAGMTQPTGWHYHLCDSQFVYVLKGWVEFEYEDVGFVRLEAGSSVVQPPRVKHRELRHSDDVEMLEITSPAEFVTRIVPGA